MLQRANRPTKVISGQCWRNVVHIDELKRHIAIKYRAVHEVRFENMVQRPRVLLRFRPAASREFFWRKIGDRNLYALRGQITGYGFLPDAKPESARIRSYAIVLVQRLQEKHELP